MSVSLKRVIGSVSMKSVDSHDHALLAGFATSPVSEQARVAGCGMVLGIQEVPGIYDTAAQQSARDEMWICLEPSEYVTGLACESHDRNREREPIVLGQHRRHTAWVRSEGLAKQQGACDLNVVVYGARKWCRLALEGRPAALLALFAAEGDVVYQNCAGAELVANAHRFVSGLAAESFLGHLRSQKLAMAGEPGAHTGRSELVARHGYDTWFAMHALRLGLQGVELLTTGRITLPVPEPGLSRLKAIRQGELSLKEVVEDVAAVEEELVALRRNSDVPQQPDRQWVDDWLHRSHVDYWAASS